MDQNTTMFDRANAIFFLLSIYYYWILWFILFHLNLLLFFRSHSQLVYIPTKCTTNIHKNIDSIDKIICHISYLRSIYYIFCLFFVFIFFPFFYCHINKNKKRTRLIIILLFFLCILMCELWNISKVFALRVKNWLNKIRQKW